MVKVAPEEATRNGPDGSRAKRKSIIIKPGAAGQEEEVSFTLLIRKGFRHLLHVSGWYDSKTAVGLRKLLHGRAFAATTMLCLFIALFFGDFFVLIQVPTNIELDIILTIVLLIFSFEFFGLCLVDASYIFGFFFWMDLIGTGSMLMDMSYIVSANDATKAVIVTQGSKGASDVIVVRAARAAKLGARAGRISRVLKIMKLITSFRSSGEDDQIRVAKVISNQLTNVLSTRVAFLTICVVVVMPLFELFKYPEMDDSMGAWTKLLDRNAAEYTAAVDLGLKSQLWRRLQKEAQRCAAFYSKKNYGVFDICIGTPVGESLFKCQQTVPFDAFLSEPTRKSSIRIVSEQFIQVQFDLASPIQVEAVSGMLLIVFIVTIMVGFGMVMSQSISVIALQPLERMLTVVRQRCAQIFKYTDELKEEAEEDSDEDEEYDDWEKSSEFALLEKVVAKLTAIVHLTAANQEPELKEDMTENDLMMLNWRGGAEANTVPTRSSQQPTGAASESGSERGLTSSLLNNLSEEVIAAVDSDDFNSLDLSKEHGIALATWVVMTSEGSATWVRGNVAEQQLLKFVTTVESKYPANPFHSFAHGIDVTVSVYRYMRLISAERFISESSQFWLLVAAVAHDVGHIGVNNQYLIETTHELAVKYNDRSPLENMHCALLFQIVSDPEANIFSKMDKDLYKEMRKGIITTILHTDITQHNAMIKEMGLLYQMNSDAFDECDPVAAVTSSQQNLQLVLNMLLHGADVANPMKPWVMCEKLAHLCLDEFFAQGDLEKHEGIPVQMLNDRDKVNRPNSQIGFIEFLIAPFVEGMVNMFPPLDSLANHLGENIERWSQVWQEETTPAPEAVAKVQARVAKVVARCQASTRSQRCLPE